MAKRISKPGPKLDYYTDQGFEDEASLLLAEFGTKFSPVIAPPVPIDDIVADYLRLSVFYKDLKQEFGVDDVLGALWVNKQQVDIDMSLVPEDHPSMLGRYHFTLAHEAGHWRLHRHLFQRKANQLRLLPENIERPEYICRSNDSDPIEYQANRFASCLMMPREMLKRSWHEWRGNMDPIYLNDLLAQRQQILTAEVLRRGGFKSGENAVENMLLEHTIRPLAEKFEVSPDAMRIRLEGMNLLSRKEKEAMLFE